LTSTIFWKTYNHPAVNALGWNIKGQQNADAYLSYLISKNIHKNKNNFLKSGQKEDLIIYAYMLAMDNYFDVQASIDICKNPVIINAKSRCIQMISALIKSHSVLYKNYCDVYQLVRETKDDEQLTSDMQEEAVHEIFNYIKIYRKYCS
jgi:hypothetical protein